MVELFALYPGSRIPTIEMNCHPIARDGVSMLALFLEAGRFILAPKWKMPKSFSSGTAPFTQENLIILKNQERVLVHRYEFFPRFFDRQRHWRLGLTKTSHRTVHAVNFAGTAVCLPQFHEGRIETTRRFFVEQLTGPFPYFLLSSAAIDLGVEIEQAGEDTGYIPIDDGGGFIESK